MQSELGEEHVCVHVKSKAYQTLLEQYSKMDDLAASLYPSLCCAYQLGCQAQKCSQLLKKKIIIKPPKHVNISFCLKLSCAA